MELLQEIQKGLKENEGYVLLSSDEIGYLLGLKTSFNIFEFNLALLITRKKVYLLCTPYEKEQLKKFTPSFCKFVTVKQEEIFNEYYFFPFTIRTLIENDKIEKIYSPSHIIDSIYGVKTERVDDIILKNAAIKSEDEVQYLKRAIQITEKSIQETVKDIKPGMMEIEARNILDYNLYKNGCERRIIPSKVVFYKNSLSLHPTPGNDTYKENKNIFFSAGAMFRGQGVSLPQNFVKGNLTAKIQSIFNHLINLREELYEFIQPGVRLNEVAQFYLDNITKLKLNKNVYFSPVSIVLINDRDIPATLDNHMMIKEYMTIKISPSIFLSNFGRLQVTDIVYMNKLKDSILLTNTRYHFGV